ncbi:MAG: LysE family translocator [Candidatus Kapabacteria bacterium]|nr:LysE family translocator [Candidatus Kapabacteria bacterium]
MFALFIGAAIGFILAVPPGPVAVTVMASALRGQWKHGLWAAAGAALADGIIALAVLFASSAIMQLINDLITYHPTIALVGEIAIIAALVTYAIRLARTSIYERSAELRQELGQSVPATVLSAAATAATNIVNPTFLPSLAATFTAAVALLSRSVAVGIREKALLALGFCIGTFGWLSIIVALIVRNRKRFSLRHFMLLRRIGAAVVLVFAAVLVWHLVD